MTGTRHANGERDLCPPAVCPNLLRPATPRRDAPAAPPTNAPEDGRFRLDSNRGTPARPGGLATGAKISAFSPPPRTHSRTPSSAASPATHTRPTNPLSLSLFCCRAAGKDGPLRDLLGDERHAEVLVGCLALFLYWNTMLAGFVYDDR